MRNLKTENDRFLSEIFRDKDLYRQITERQSFKTKQNEKRQSANISLKKLEMNKT